MENGADRKRHASDLREILNIKKRKLTCNISVSPPPPPRKNDLIIRSDFRNRHLPYGDHRNNTEGYSRDRKDVSYQRTRFSGDKKRRMNNNYIGFMKLREWGDKEPHEVIVELVNHKKGFEELFRTKLTNDVIVLVLKVVAKMLLSSFYENKIEIMNLALKHNFISHLTDFVIHIPLQDEMERKSNSYFWNDVEEVFSNIAMVCKFLIEIMPTVACKVLPKCLRAVSVTVIDIESIQISDELKQNFENLQSKLEKKKQNVSAEETPPDDFRQLGIYPTSEEITKPGRAFIRANIIHGAYKSVDHYLDVQFRLLKEDFVAPLREAICNFINHKTGGRSNVKVHSNVQFKGLWSDEQKLGVLVQFDTKQKSYNFLKRFMYGSLVSFTKDQFTTVIFGKILERNAKLLMKGRIVVGFESGFDSYELNEPYIMVECSVYFEPYYHVLKALQKIDETNLPMKNYLIDVNPKIEPPAYVTPESIFDIKGHKTRVLDLNSWPSASELALDDTQYSGLQAALTQKFVVIQGPPGTGKTYLGLEIAKTLIKKEKMMWKDARTPILVVSYTNHALDQFLEGLISTTEDIVRVGGQSKNKNLEKFNLKILRRMCANHKGKVKHALHDLKREVGGQFFNIEDLNKKLHETEKYIGVLDFRYFVAVDSDLRNSWFASASDQEIKNWLFGGRNNRQLYVEMKQAQKEKPNWQKKDVQYGERGGLDWEMDDLFNAEYRKRLEIDDDFDLEETRQTTMYKAHTYLVTISDMEKAIEYASENLKKTRYNRHKIKQELYKLKDELDYLMIHLKKDNLMKSARKPENCDLNNPHAMIASDRWMLYFHWVELYKAFLRNKLQQNQTVYQDKYNQFTEIKDIDDADIMKQKLVIGMTTTGAARLHKTLQKLKCHTVIVEEAAEVLESHIVVSLTNHCQHLILIGDHQQLRPSTADYCIEHHYNLGISLFERMVLNNIQCHVLGVQHRMRPEIAKLIVPAIYPTLINHPSVSKYPSVLGIDHSVYFIDHNRPEEESSNTSKVNKHEVTFLINLARYFIHNGYKPEDITILAAYSGQMFAFWRERRLDNVLTDVHITCLDNYQGEENKIILLSLVRNNKEDKIGFLKIENRVCVALSRAKEGFYMMGNMDLLCRNSEIWPKVKETLVSLECLGNNLTLRCQTHTDVITKVELAEDFLKVLEGGCKKMCEVKLNCGHTCPKNCHIFDRHHERFICKEKCLKMCENNKHKCHKLCFENCGQCQIRMQKQLPCTHEEILPCCMKPEDYICTKPVHVQLPCGHEVPDKPCFKDIKTFKCPVPCAARIEPCGHSCVRPCHVTDDPDHLRYKCRKPCARPKVNCSTGTHMCPGRCFIPCPPCEVFILKTRSICSHSKVVKCNVDANEVFCSKPCKKTLPCGHKCASMCGDPCGNCERKVEKEVIECGHTVTIKCYQKPDVKLCAGKCPIILSCGHACQNTCNKPCTSNCKELVDYTKPTACGHNFKIECNLAHKELPSTSYKILQFCREPCGFILDCSHPCSGTCGECAQGRFHQSCKEKSKALLTCGHESLVLCSLTYQPCNHKCSYKCPHSICRKMCGEPCTKCVKYCKRQCRHIKCRAKCGDICTVPPCTRPCYKLLPCRHHCIGFCGDPCPPLCRICNRKELTRLFLGYEDEKDARFVLLDECKHVVESQGMEEWLQVDEGEINCNTCPKCKTPLASTQRYSDYIKRAMKDVAALKTTDYGNSRENKAEQVELFEKVIYLQKNCQKLCKYVPIMSKLIKYLENKLASGFIDCQWLNIALIRIFASGIHIIEKIIELFNKANLKNKNVIEKATTYIKFLLECLMKRITCPEIADFEKELERLERIIELCLVEDQPYFETVIKNKADVKTIHEEIIAIVFKPTAYTKDLNKNLKKKLTNFNKEVQANITIIEKEIKETSLLDIKPELDLKVEECNEYEESGTLLATHW